MVWDAEDTAFDMKGVANLEEWNMAECDGVIESGTAQSAIPIIAGGGWGEKARPKSNREKKKNKLPGVSAHQN